MVGGCGASLGIVVWSQAIWECGLIKIIMFIYEWGRAVGYLNRQAILYPGPSNVLLVDVVE